MSSHLEDYHQGSVDWRKSTRMNNRRTVFVISLFFLIYLVLGLLVDMTIFANAHPEATFQEIVQALLNLNIFPIATLIMLGVAWISLMITFTMHDRLMLLGTEYREITPATATSMTEKQLYNVIEELKIAAGLKFMPRVYIIDADYMNAFASGYSEKSAMVAITRGLLEKLTRSELTAVMAHELSHIRNMDIKLTLMASLLANLMLMVLDIFFYNAMYSRRENGRSRNFLTGVIILLRYILPIINVLLLLYLSRTREYLADAGSVELLRDNKPLASALLKIQADHENNRDQYTLAYQQTPHENVRQEAYIFDPVQAGVKPFISIADAFSTHPNIKDRLAALGFKYGKD